SGEHEDTVVEHVIGVVLRVGGLSGEQHPVVRAGQRRKDLQSEVRQLSWCGWSWSYSGRQSHKGKGVLLRRSAKRDRRGVDGCRRQRQEQDAWIRQEADGSGSQRGRDVHSRALQEITRTGRSRAVISDT